MTIPQDVCMHGASNRFLLHFGTKSPKKLLRSLNEIDGVLILHDDEIADVRVQIFNADGSEAEQCGNGLRCIALHMVRSNIIQGSKVVIKTLAGLHTCIVHQDRNEVEVSLGESILGADVCNVDATILGDLPELIFVNMGNPNAVMWTEKDPIVVRDEWGELIVKHPAFQDGMNLHVARRDGEYFATCASWERGVGPTLASGTGGASVFVSVIQSKFPDVINTQQSMYISSLGGTLSYRYDDNGHVVMTGPAGYS